MKIRLRAVGASMTSTRHATAVPYSGSPGRSPRLPVAATVACLILLICGCVHTPPGPPATPTATPTPAATPTPVVTPSATPTPDIPLVVAVWGADGTRFENATRVGHLFPTEVTPLGPPGVMASILGDLEVTVSDDEDRAENMRTRLPGYLNQNRKNGSRVWAGCDWAGVVWTEVNGRREVQDAPLIRVLFDVLAPYSDVVFAYMMLDESGWPTEWMEAGARYLRRLESERHMPPKPIVVTYQEKEQWEQSSQMAIDIDVVAWEAYDAGMGSGSRAEDCRLITSALDRQYAMLPAGKRYAIWYAAYNRNDGWTQSVEDLAALPECTTRWIQAHRERFAFASLFCYARKGDCGNADYCGGGFRDFPVLKTQVKRSVKWLVTGADPGPAVPPTVKPTPVPTPEPTAPGELTPVSQAVPVSRPALTAVVGIKRVDAGSKAPTAYVDYRVELRSGTCYTAAQSGRLALGPGDSVAEVVVQMVDTPTPEMCVVDVWFSNATIPLLGTLSEVKRTDNREAFSWSTSWTPVVAGNPPAAGLYRHGAKDYDVTLCVEAQSGGQYLDFARNGCTTIPAGTALASAGITTHADAHGQTAEVCITSARLIPGPGSDITAEVVEPRCIELRIK